MPRLVTIFLLIFLATGLNAQSTPQTSSAEDYSGMYTFLQEGEFLQLTVEDQGKLTGFVSRYADSQDDDRAFVDHFFKQGRIDGNKLSFATEAVQNIYYDFKGSVERGDGKKPGDEAYYVLNGTLTQYATDANHKTTSKSQRVQFKSFPGDVDGAK